jgi:hypothetical protein
VAQRSDSEREEAQNIKHFTPDYWPGQQRICRVPDGDMFKAIRDGKVKMVTDHMERFVGGEDRLYERSPHRPPHRRFKSPNCQTHNVCQSRKYPLCFNALFGC